MSIRTNEVNFYRKNGYLVKENLIPIKEVKKINNIVKKIISKEKKKKIQIKNQGGIQSYNNYHFVYNSNSSKNKQILRLNNPQNRHQIFFEISRSKKIISIVKKANWRNSKIPSREIKF